MASCAHAQKTSSPVVAGDQTATPIVVTDPSPARPAPLIKRGTGDFAQIPQTVQATPNADPQKLSIAFDRTPVAIVVQTLLTDTVGANVIIDPRVQGDLTIRSQGQITAAELPEFLKQSVRPLGLELLDRGPNTYLLRPIPTGEDAAVPPDVYRAGQPIPAGGIILPLKYVSATEMARLLQPFAKNGVTVQAESTREFLMLTGPPGQVEALVKTVELLDVDWLKGMSFGLVPLETREPDSVIADLKKLFGGDTGPIGSMIEFVPLKDRRAILVLAKRPERLDEAQTWILQLDRADDGRTGRLHVIPIVNGDATKVSETVSGLFDQKDAAVKISVDVAHNALIVQSDTATFRDIETLVANLDKPPDQVQIEATIAEVTLNDELKFGVQWFFDTRNGGKATFSDASNGSVTSKFPGFSYGYTGKYVQASLNALSSKTKVDVISSPVVMTLDNEEASLQIGDQVPIVTQSAVNLTTPGSAIVNSVQYRDTGIVLKVIPHIGADGRITLDVTQEASEVSATTTSGIDSPTIAQRRFKSKVLIADGETVALGGLIRANRSIGKSGLPILKDIPLLGLAFRTSTSSVRRTELIVYLTPKIIRSPEDARTFTEDLRDKLLRLRRSKFIARYAPS